MFTKRTATIVALCTMSVLGATKVEPNNPNISLFGRVTSDFRYDWPGVYLKTTFTGSSVSAIFSGEGQYTVIVDGIEKPKLFTSGTDKTYTVATGLSNGDHTLCISKVNETNFGVQGFGGLLLDDGAVLKAPKISSHSIEYIGDSFMVGYGAESSTNNHPDGTKAVTDSTNTYKAFPGVASRLVGAEYMVNAYSGLGVLNDANGNSAETVPAYYDYTLHSSKSAPWDFSRVTPDIVVVGLQINDFVGNANQAAYEKALSAFVDKILDNYSKHPYIILNSTSVYLHPEALVAVKNVVNSQVTKGNKVFLFNYEYSALGFSAWNAVHWHPNVAEHEGIGKSLAKTINEIVDKNGWPIKGDPIPPFTLTVSANHGKITLSPDKKEYDKGEKVTVTVTANEGFDFSNWVGKGITSKEKTIVVTMESNMTISAMFREQMKNPSENFVANTALWSFGADNLGSKVTLLTSSDIESKFEIVAQPNDSTWPWGSLSMHPGNAFTGVTHLKVIYQSEKELVITLPQAILSDKGESYIAKVPASPEGFSEAILSISNNFAQPSWVVKKSNLELSAIEGVGFYPVVADPKKGGISTVKIKEVILYGYTPTPISKQTGIAQILSPKMGIVGSQLKLSSLHSGKYELQLFGMNGRELYRSSLVVTGDSHKVDLGTTLTPSIYLVSLTGEGNRYIQKCIAK